MSGACSTHGLDKYIFTRKFEGKSPFGRSRSKWDKRIKIGINKIGWESLNWIHLARNGDQWRDLVAAVMNFTVPQKACNFLTSQAYFS
jgi:hypothetical protein